MAFKATEQPVGTGTAAGQAFLDMLGACAKFETNLRRERQAEGIAKATGGASAWSKYGLRCEAGVTGRLRLSTVLPAGAENAEAEDNRSIHAATPLRPVLTHRDGAERPAGPVHAFSLTPGVPFQASGMTNAAKLTRTPHREERP